MVKSSIKDNATNFFLSHTNKFASFFILKILFKPKNPKIRLFFAFPLCNICIANPNGRVVYNLNNALKVSSLSLYQSA